MLTLVTSNPAKYASFRADLERMRITFEAPKQDLPEQQSLGFADALRAKAQASAAYWGRPVLVDDAGIVLEAYHPFPGPLTSVVLRSLGQAGLARLLSGVSNRANMECHIGCWIGGRLRCWSGTVPGRLDCSREVRDPRMILTDHFVPDESVAPGLLAHRARALQALEAEVFDLHLEMASETAAQTGPSAASPACPFCLELEGDPSSVFAEMMGRQLSSRIVYEDEDFVIVPPLGQFMPGGLLLLSRDHIPSFAFLPGTKFDKLENLLDVVRQVLVERWGVAPLVFEHGPAADRTKGHCCVDHAHFNIFPAPVHLHPHLSSRMNLPVRGLNQLGRLTRAEFGYLFVQENDGTRRAYDGQYAPTQLVRRIITSQLGMADRWHWRDFPGCAELIQTYNALRGQIRV